MDSKESSKDKSTPPDWRKLAGLSPSGPMQPTTPVWPNAAPKDMQAYQFTCPMTGAEMVGMTVHTWTVNGTNLQNLVRIAKKQDAELKAVKTDLQVMTQRAADAERRLNNLRAVRKKEMRKDLEDQLNLPKELKNVEDEGQSGPHPQRDPE